MTTHRDYNATIVRRETLRDTLIMLWIEPDSGEFPPFRPGQFVSVGRLAGDGDRRLITRSYSIGSSAHERRNVQIFVVHVNDGEFTSWLFAQPVGARVWLSPKAGGGFTLDGFTPGTDIVLVSTGTAIAPFVSMYRTHRADPPWRRIVIVNGVRESADLGFRAELEAAAKQDPRLRYLPTVSREPAGSPWDGLRGRVTETLDPGRYEALVGAPLDPEHCHVYLCGNPEMIETLEAILHRRGFRKHTRHEPGNMHLEKYWTE